MVLCSGGFTGLQSLVVLSKLPAHWVPRAVHRSFVPAFHGMSALTSLTKLVMQRTAGVCVLIETLSTLTRLEMLSVIGVEHDPDSLRELGSYLSKFKKLQRLELDIMPLGAAIEAVGGMGRGMPLLCAYANYTRGRQLPGLDSDEELSEDDQTEEAEAVAGIHYSTFARCGMSWSACFACSPLSYVAFLHA